MVELAAGWLAVLLEVGWCGAAAWWWKLETDADCYAMSKCLQCKYTKNVHNCQITTYFEFCVILYSLFADFIAFNRWGGS